MSATLEKPKPGLAAAILIPLFIWIVFSIAAVVVLVLGIQRAEEIDDELARIPAGEPSQVELTEAGDYRIWLDCPDGNDYGTVSATGTITGPDGQDIPVESYVGSLSYNDLDAVLTFEAPTEGSYTFQLLDTGTSSCSGPQFAIGKDNPFAAAGTAVLIMLVVGSIGFVIALILLIVMLVKRGRSKRRITQASFPGGGYGGGYPPQGGYPPPGGYQQPGPSW